MKRAVRLAAIVATALAIAGCSQNISSPSQQQGPVGVGRSINQLKGTPCACTEIPMVIPTSMAA